MLYFNDIFDNILDIFQQRCKDRKADEEILLVFCGLYHFPDICETLWAFSFHMHAMVLCGNLYEGSSQESQVQTVVIIHNS